MRRLFFGLGGGCLSVLKNFVGLGNILLHTKQPHTQQVAKDDET